MSTTTTTETTTVTPKTTAKKSIDWVKISIYSIAALAVIAAVYFGFSNRGLNTDLVKEREGVMRLTEERSKLQTQVQELNLQNEKLDASLQIANQDLTAKEILLDRLNKENETLRIIKERMVELQKVSASLAANNEQLLKMQSEISKLIDIKQQENRKLQENLKK